MSSYPRLLVLIVAVCWRVTSGNLSCKPQCHVDAALGCSVRYAGQYCTSTALLSSPVWPGKPRDLTLTQFSPLLERYKGDVGMNISWRMPGDASALSVRGFQLTVMLLGAMVNGIQSCFQYNFTGSREVITLQTLVDSVFTLECYMTRRVETVCAELYSLPRPTNNKYNYMVRKYKAITEQLVSTTPDPCGPDPRVSVIVVPNVRPLQLVVNLGKSAHGGIYMVSLMRGSYQIDKQTIQPGNTLGKDRAVFENSARLREGVCFDIWVERTNYSSAVCYWSPRTNYCIPITTTTTTTTTTFSSGIMSRLEMDKQTDEITTAPMSTTTIIIVVVVVVSTIVILGAITIFLILRRRQEFPPNNVRVPPKEISEIKAIVVFYDVSNEESVRSFLDYLNSVAPGVKTYDFVDRVRMDKNDLKWMKTTTGKVLSTGGRLLIIYSHGLVKVLGAADKDQSYPIYEEQRFGIYVRLFLAFFQKQLFLKQDHEMRECVVSLGEEFQTEFLPKTLIQYSSVKYNLVSRDGKNCIVNEEQMTHFLKWLGVDPDDIPTAMDTTKSRVFVQQVEKTLNRDASQDWVSRFGHPLQIECDPHDPDTETDSTSVYSGSSGSSEGSGGNGSSASSRSQGEVRGSSGIGTGEFQDDLVLTSVTCPDNVDFSPPADIDFPPEDLSQDSQL